MAAQHLATPRAHPAPQRAPRWMGMLFAVGSTCFLVGPFPGYLQLVGATVVGWTFFVGSLFFTTAGGLQSRLAAPDRHTPGAGRSAWMAALVQSAGTLFFNVSTGHALATVVGSSHYDRLVWRPDALGSICFLVSGWVAYRASPRHGWRPARTGSGWWTPLVNLFGCVFFGVSAIAGYVVPAGTSVLDQAAANWNTSAGAACFLACAVQAVRQTRRAPAAPPTRPVPAG